MFFLPLIVIAAIAIYLISFYNGLKTTQVRIRASIQEIGNQLKRQANLIPNLVDSVKGYMKHEKDVFKMLTDARAKVDQAAKSGKASHIDQAQEAITKVLGSLQVVVESTPEIKASVLVNNLMDELRDTADKLMYARRTLIDLTADFNTAISTIPGVWLAPMFGFKEEAGLAMPADTSATTVSDSETSNPKVDLS